MLYIHKYAYIILHNSTTYTQTHLGYSERLAEILSSDKPKPPWCGSFQHNTERHIPSRCVSQYVSLESDGLFRSRSLKRRGETTPTELSLSLCSCSSLSIFICSSLLPPSHLSLSFSMA